MSFAHEWIDLLSQVHWCDASEVEQQLRTRGVQLHLDGIGVQAPKVAHHLKQTHSTVILTANQQSQASATLRAEGDGLYSWQRGTTVAVKTADCLPVLMVDPQHDFVAAVHAGWRGLVGGIVQNALDIYLAAALPATSLRMVLGPCIGPAHFEVGPEVVSMPWTEDGCLSREAFLLALTKGKNDRWYIDLAKIALCQALQRGVLPENIWVARECTYSQKERWNSYRREGRVIGSNWSSLTLA